MLLDQLEKLHLNVNATLFVPDKGSNEVSAGIFNGVIYSKETDNSIVIRLNTGDDGDFFCKGRPIFLFIAYDLGVYIFSVTVNEKEITDGNTFIYCENPRQIEYFQRRKNVRVDVSIPVNFSAAGNRSKIFEGTVTDMSIGGMKLKNSFSIPAGTTIELVFDLDNIGPVFLDGEVLRVSEKNGQYYHGIKLINPDSHTVDGIAKYVMAEQIRQKRLGMQIFKAFIFNAVLEVQAPAMFSIVHFKDLDISALQGKTCSGTITEVGLNGLKVICPLKLPVGARLEFIAEIPSLGQLVINADVTNVDTENGKFIVNAHYCSEYKKIRDCILRNLAEDFGIPASAYASE